MINIAFDMETADPDDLLTLCFLAHNPKVNLVCVTVTPGTPEQMGMLREVFDRLQISVPLGAKNPKHREGETNHLGKYVPLFYYKVLRPKFTDVDIFEGKEDALGHDVLYEAIKKYPDLTLVTGAPLHNLRLLLDNHPDVVLQHWVAQGGFAGDSVVEPENRLAKFNGKETCETFNFNGDPKGALLALESPQILKRTLVSKNVCHGVAYDKDFHIQYNNVKKKNLGTKLIFEAMSVYLKSHDQKALHDPLAACVVLNPAICKFKRVNVYREKGKWGSRLNPESTTEISVSVNMEAFFKEFLMENT